jgi:LL-diaminopimelate aminotransferase
MIKKVILDKSERLQKVPPYSLFEMERMKKRLEEKKVEIIDLGEFSPDLKMDPSIISEISESVKDEKIFKDASFDEEKKLKEGICRWFLKRYSVKLNPQNEILVMPGIKEVFSGLALSFLNPGDLAIIPDPANPLYFSACVLAGGEVQKIPIWERNDFLPNLKTLPEKVLKKAKLLFLNYPHNPTSSMADIQFFKDMVEITSANNIIVIHDASFNEIYYDNHLPLSLLQIDRAKKIGVEFHSISYTYNLPGIKLGFLVGNKDIILGLESEHKTFFSQENKLSLKIALLCLENYSEIIRKNNCQYAKRREFLTEKLLELGWKSRKPRATPFFWVQIPHGYSSLGFARMLLRKAGVIVSCGSDFGENGEGYIRWTLNCSQEKLNEAIERIKRHSHLWQPSYRPKRKKLEG